MKKIRFGHCKIFYEVRTMLGWSKYKMAAELGVSYSHYDYIERTSKSVNPTHIKRLFELWGGDANVFLKML